MKKATSHSANDFVSIIGRSLKVEDVFIDRDRVFRNTKSYEIVDFGTVTRGIFLKHEVPTVELRELTESGPGNEILSVPLNKKRWADIVREGDRFDKPSLRER